MDIVDHITMFASEHVSSTQTKRRETPTNQFALYPAFPLYVIDDIGVGSFIFIGVDKAVKQKSSWRQVEDMPKAAAAVLLAPSLCPAEEELKLVPRFIHVIRIIENSVSDFVSDAKKVESFVYFLHDVYAHMLRCDLWSFPCS